MSLSFSKRLSKAIADSPLKQTEIADIAGITPPYLSDLKTGKKTNPSQDLVAKLATALSVSYRWLLLGDESDNLTENAEITESSTNPNLLQEESAPYGEEKMRNILYALLDTADPSLLFDQLDAYQQKAFDGDLTARALIAEIMPRLRRRFSKNPPTDNP